MLPATFFPPYRVLYKKKKINKPWIAYFSDPWTDNPYTNYLTEKIYQYNLELEKKVIESADKILFTSQEMLKLVMRKYNNEFLNKCSVLPHCFVPEWYEISNYKNEKNDNKKIKIIQTGHFYGPRTPMPLFNVIDKLNKEIDLAQKIEFKFYGNMDLKYKEFIANKGLDKIIKINNPIPYLDSLAVMKSSDYLLLIDAPLKNNSENVFLPSKLIDYIGSYKPVIGITPAQGASARVLNETRNILCDIQREEDIYNIFKKLINDNLSTQPDKEKILRYHYKEVTKILTNLIKSLS